MVSLPSFLASGLCVAMYVLCIDNDMKLKRCNCCVLQRKEMWKMTSMITFSPIWYFVIDEHKEVSIIIFDVYFIQVSDVRVIKNQLSLTKIIIVHHKN